MNKHFWTALWFVLLSQLALADVGESLAIQGQTDTKAKASQSRIDTMADKTSSAAQQYRGALQRAESLKVYNIQLEKLIASQEQEKASIMAQTEQIDTIETGVLPLMIQMTAALSKLIEADTPFLVKERTDRVDGLLTLIDRADVTVGEKYRRIMEAYVIEAEYGKTIEAYKGEIEQNGVRSVDFLRIGRVGLYYQTLDGEESGRWDADSESWVLLPRSYRVSIRDGLRVARKQAPPELLKLPVTAPEV